MKLPLALGKPNTHGGVLPLVLGKKNLIPADLPPPPPPVPPPPPPPAPPPKPAALRRLLPLELSHTNGAVEDELKRLAIRLFQTHLNDAAADVNCYGMPHLGGKMLLQKCLVSQGISNFNVSSLDEETARWLLMAWRYCNGKRGTHFLRTFITCLWGSDFEIHPLWQKKSGTYPHDLKTAAEIIDDGENLDDYFLTPRLSIILEGASGYFASEIAKSLNTVLPARLFVVSVGRINKAATQLGCVVSASGFSLVKGIAKDTSSSADFHTASPLIHISAHGGAYSIAYGTAVADNPERTA